MDKFETFFVNGEILSKKDFDTLKEYSDFEISLPNENLDKILIKLSLKQPLPLDLFRKLEVQREKWQKELAFWN